MTGFYKRCNTGQKWIKVFDIFISELKKKVISVPGY